MEASGIFATERGQTFLLMLKRMLWKNNTRDFKSLKTCGKSDLSFVTVDDAFKTAMQSLFAEYAAEFDYTGRPPSTNTFLLYFFRSLATNPRIDSINSSPVAEAFCCMDAARESFFAISNKGNEKHATTLSTVSSRHTLLSRPRKMDDTVSYVDTTIHPDDSVSNIGSSDDSQKDKKERAQPPENDTISVAFSRVSDAKKLRTRN